MKLVQKILSHGLLIIFVLAAIFIYTRRDEILPQWFGKPAGAGQHSGQVVKEKTSPVASKKQPTVNTDKVTENTVTSSPPGTDNLPQQNAPQPTFPPEFTDDKLTGAGNGGLVESDTEQTGGKKPTAPETEQAGENEPAVTGAQQTGDEGATPPAAEPAVMAGEAPDTGNIPEPGDIPVTPQNEPATEPSAVVETTDDAVTLQEQLIEARRYFWQHNLPAAEEAYRLLTERYPDNPDLWGEVGNFYFSLRQREPAIEAYSRSVELLISNDETVRAREIVKVLYRLGAPQASRLEMQLKQQKGS